MKLVSLTPLYVVLLVFALYLVGYLLCQTIGLSFTKNTSPSAPIGVYALRAPANLKKGDFVTMKLPSRLLRFAEKTPWLHPERPLLKTVAALSKDTVCLKEGRLFINGVPVARAKARDRQGRRLPHWRGCQTLRSGQFLALNTYSSRSFDGRYFGPSKLSAVTFKAIPVLTFKELLS